MIRVTVELISAKTGKTSTLGRAYIANDVKTSFETEGERGSYNYKVFGKRDQILRLGRVENFPRKRLLAWDLLYCVLRKAVGQRNQEKKCPT